MARHKKNREINVFSASAIDLFASSLGVFIVLVIILFPYFTKKSKTTIEMIEKKTKQIKILKIEINKKDDIIKEFKLINFDTKNKDQKIKLLTEDLKKMSRDTEKIITKYEKGMVLLEQEKTKRSDSELKKALRKETIKNKKLQRKLKSKEKIIVKMDTNNENLSDSKVKQEELKLKVEALEKDIEEYTNEISEKDQDIKKLTSKITDSQQELEKAKKTGLFALIMIKWETNKHDIDLYIKDPMGKVFNFKKRKYKNHPGELIVDSRTGPGAEIWQVNNFTPGKYELTFKFYNNYGNPLPTVIFGSIVTKKGNIKLPPIKMDFSKNKFERIIFRINKEADVKIEKLH